MKEKKKKVDKEDEKEADKICMMSLVNNAKGREGKFATTFQVDHLILLPWFCKTDEKTHEEKTRKKDKSSEKKYGERKREREGEQ